MSLSENGEQLLALDNKGKRYAWSLETEEPLAADQFWPASGDLPEIWSNPQWWLSAQQNLIWAFDNSGDLRTEEAAYRRFNTQIYPVWHALRAADCLKRISRKMDSLEPLQQSEQNRSCASDYFELLFHRYWEWRDEPENIERLLILHEAFALWSGVSQLLNPAANSESGVQVELTQTKPEDYLPLEMAKALREYQSLTVSFNEDSSSNINNRIWEKVKTQAPSNPLTNLEVWMLEAINRQFPSSNYLNTLGVAYYRKGRLEEAVATLSRSATEFQKDNGLPTQHPGDLAFLALSELALGHREKADEWQRQLYSVMESAAYREDAECQLFLKEVQGKFSEAKD